MINTLHTSSYKYLCGNKGIWGWFGLMVPKSPGVLDTSYARRFVLVSKLVEKQPGVQKFLLYFLKAK